MLRHFDPRGRAPDTSTARPIKCPAKALLSGSFCSPRALQDGCCLTSWTLNLLSETHDYELSRPSIFVFSYLSMDFLTILLGSRFNIPHKGHEEAIHATQSVEVKLSVSVVSRRTPQFTQVCTRTFGPLCSIQQTHSHKD